MRQSLRVVTCAAALALAGPAVAGAQQQNLPPGATTSDATEVSNTSAKLNGVVDSHKEDTNYFFEYGPTTAYGTQTPTQTEPASNAAHEVFAVITGLTACTTYHFRLVATNQFGTDQGQDKSFTTGGCPPPPPPPPPVYPLPGANAVTIAAVPAVITFGRSTVISGQVTGPNNAGVQVLIQQAPFPFTGPFGNAATVATDATGRYTFATAPRLHTRYLAVARTSPPVTSATVGVTVRYAVGIRLSDSTVRRGQFVRFFGSVRPAHNGRTIQIQRRSRTGRYVTVARTRLRRTTNPARSSYSRRLQIFRTATYRVRVGADADHATNTSRRRRITVR